MSRDEDVFAGALALPAGERAVFLDRAGAEDPAQRARVEELLAGYAEAERAIPGAFFTREIKLPEEMPGDKIGRYKLLEKIGEGGCGAVWMAEQEEPVHRRVALKVIRLGMDTKEVIARFEAERQALALMDHPNIARIFDGGCTDAGRPFFVMELVRGIPITHFCDDASLPTERRLQLFIQVCHAIQHAHQKGVIHRDIKPSNILVTLHDDVAVPKVIDFGIAKATGARLTDKTLFTHFHAFIGTPTYTSPEQIEMSGLDVDTRSDIYSLGVLLYELMTGRPPFDSDALVRSGLEAMRRTIREVDPPRPSMRLGTLSENDRTSVAQQRGTDPAKLSHLLRGDLDWIAMRCLEKDRKRRYDSAAGLAADVERHLTDDPVVARPPSQFYRTTKFIRRHKVGVTAGAAVAVSLIAGLIASSALFVRERSAHSRATVAEKREGELRRKAEVDGANEVKRAARTALDLANRNLADRRVADGLAYLVYAWRKDPKNTTLGPRLASALAMHNFLLPEGPAFDCSSRVLAVRFTKDGRSIFVGTEDGTFRVLDAATGRLQREFQLGRPMMLNGWEFPRNNDTVFAARFADNTLGVFEVESGLPRWAPRALDATVWKDSEYLALGHGVGISPDGRWIYALSLYRFWIWDAATGDVLLQPEYDGRQTVTSCDFSPDGAQLAVMVGGLVHRWTLPDASSLGPPTAVQRGSTVGSATLTVRFSPDGHRIAVANFTGISVHDATTGEHLRELPPVGAIINSPSVAFASNTRVFGACSSASGTWNLTSGEFKPLPIGLGADVTSTSFDAAGRRMLATGADGFARLCDLDSGELVAEPAGRQHRVFSAALAPDGAHVVIGTAAGAVQRLRVGRGAAQPLVLRQIPLLRLPAPFLPDAPARVLLMRRDRARMIDLASGRETAGGFAFPEPVLHMSWLFRVKPVRPDLKFVVVRTGEGWQAWELDAAGIVRVAMLEGSPSGGGPVRFSLRGDLVMITYPPEPGGTGKMGVWNLRTGTRAGPEFVYPSALVEFSPSLDPDGKRVALGAEDGTCMIIDVATASRVLNLATRPLVPNLVSFSPDGARVVTFNIRNEARVWDAATGKPLGPVLDAEHWWGGLLHSRDGRWFATWGVHTTSLRDGRTGAPVGETIPAGGRMVSFSRDGRSLATAEDTGSSQVWDVPGGQPFTEPMRLRPERPGFLGSPEFSPDGRFLCTETYEEFYFWSVPPRLPDNTPVPEWLLRLATVLATKTVDDAGQLVDVPDAMTQFHDVLRQIAALPADAPLSDWGRWIVDDRTDRSIAPGFTVTPADAEKLAASLAADLAAKP